MKINLKYLQDVCFDVAFVLVESTLNPRTVGTLTFACLINVPFAYSVLSSY